jgi:hypothetical protein
MIALFVEGAESAGIKGECGRGDGLVCLSLENAGGEDRSIAHEDGEEVQSTGLWSHSQFDGLDGNGGAAVAGI